MFGAQSSKGNVRSALFGKAVSSATGRAVGAQASSSRSHATLASHNAGIRNPSSSLHQRIGVQPASSRSHATLASRNAGPPSRPGGAFRRPSKREPVPEGLYDDLPPPDDWSEDASVRF